MTITVTQLGNFLKALVDSETVLFDLNVEGEISGFRRNGEVAFFVLKDAGAQIDCFFYNPPSISLIDGQKAIVSGKPNYYIKGGKLSFAVKKITPKDERGEKYKELMLLKERLEKEGLFDPLKKKPIVADSAKIGVVTSAEGAAIHDILTVASRRNPAVDVLLYHCKVQGSGSEASIVRGIKYLENKPTISAVGHETDITLCDLAADKRAATPSQAAEICTADVRGKLLFIENRLKALLLHRQNYVEQKSAAIDSKEKLLLTISSRIYSSAEAWLKALYSSLAVSAEKRLAAADSALRLAAVRLDENNPAKILSKGYTVTLKKGATISSVKALKAGDEISVVFSDGLAHAAVTETEVKK